MYYSTLHMPILSRLKKNGQTIQLFKNLTAVKEGNAHKVSDIIWNTAGGVIAANIMLDEIEKIFTGK